MAAAAAIKKSKETVQCFQLATEKQNGEPIFDLILVFISTP